MRIDFDGISLYCLLISLFLLNYCNAFNLIPPQLSSSCMNISIRNITYGRIHSFNFYAGQSQPPNVSCSWIIHNSQTSIWSNYIFSLRIIELENDPTRWSNELSFWTGNRQIPLDDVNKRTYLISTSSPSVQIYFRSKPPLLQTYNPYIRTNLRVRRFSIEFLHMNHQLTTNDNDQYFRCSSSEILIPKQWRCNCIQECSYGDQSDEENCPLCSMYEPTTNLLCQSNEIWCLPGAWQSQNENVITEGIDENLWMQAHRRYSQKIDPKGVCIPRGADQKCVYSTNYSMCQTTLVRRQDHGQILLDNTMLNSYQTLCFVIVAKEEHKIKLLINQYQTIGEFSEFELMIYDGSQEQNYLLFSSTNFLAKQMVQTRQHNIATIITRRHSPPLTHNLIHSYVDEDVVGHIDINETAKRVVRRDTNTILFNLTWLTSICPDDQMLCGGHFETKCYTAEKRCDGVWDCISGDDELGCSPESCPTTFACNNHLHLPSDQPRCFTWSERCNGNSFCANRTDEKLCTSWWCNSNNGTFLCKNLNCIYEAWVCDGADDCGDRSDEKNCPSRVPRRIVTAAVIGATVCSTLFIIALGCTCKLFHLRTSERRAASRLLNPQHYIEQRRQQYQREQEQRGNRQQQQQQQQQQSISTASDPPSTISNDARRIAPPSYNQTMGLVDENEERHAALAEHLRLAGLANYISLPAIHTSSRTSRSSSRHRHRRHRRHRHHHHHRRAHSEGSRVALLEPTVVVANAAFSQPSTSLSLSRLSRFRSQLRSLFTTITANQTVPPSSTTTATTCSETHERRHRTRATATQTSDPGSRSFSGSDFVHPRELPPPYTEQASIASYPNGLSLSTAMNISRRSSSDASEMGSNSSRTGNSSSMYRLRKRELPIHTLRDRMRQFISGSSVRLGSEELNHPMQPTTMMSTTAMMATTTNLLTSDENFEATRPIASIGNDEQPSSEDDKMLTP